MIKMNALFLCSGNSCRTQMAEAMLRQSPGTGSRYPEAVEAMREIGIDISHHETKIVDGYLFLSS